MAAMNKIQDKLFLGNIKSASDLKLLKQNVSLYLFVFLFYFLMIRDQINHLFSFQSRISEH